jgi:hypothetical protein
LKVKKLETLRPSTFRPNAAGTENELRGRLNDY